MWTVAGNSVASDRKEAELAVFIHAAYFAIRPQAILDEVSLGRRLEDELTRSIAVVTSSPCTRAAADYAYAKQQYLLP